MPQKFLAIVRTTFIETVRQPIYSVLLWVAVGLLVLNPSIAAFSLESGGDNKVMKDIALSTLLLFGLFASVFSATSVITREIESFTVLTVVSKPVSRPLFLVGKYAGVVAALFVAYILLAVVVLMTVRHGVMETNADKYDLPVITLGIAALVVSLLVAGFANFVYGWHFPSTLLAWVTPLAVAAIVTALFFDKQWKPKTPNDFTDMQIIYAMILVFVAAMMIAAFAVTFSTRFGQVVTLLLCAGVFLLGLLSDYYFGSGDTTRPVIYQVLYGAVPNFQFFWLGDAITQDLGIRADQVLRVVLYGLAYSAAITSVGVAMFQTREVG